MEVLHAIDDFIRLVKPYDPKSQAAWAGHYYSRGNSRGGDSQYKIAKAKRVAKRRDKKGYR